MKSKPGLDNAIMTYTGGYFDLLNPDLCHCSIYDVAHALANQCRFGGHLKSFYSVAQHSVLVSFTVPREYALIGLLHDIAEAYIGDIPSPLKALLPDYRELEQRIERSLFQRFGFDAIPVEVKHADLILLATERRDLAIENIEPWPCLVDIEPLPEKICPVHPVAAKRAFLSRYRELTGAGVRVS